MPETLAERVLRRTEDPDERAAFEKEFGRDAATAVDPEPDDEPELGGEG